MTPELAEKIETLKESRETVNRTMIEIVSDMASSKSTLHAIAEAIGRSTSFVSLFAATHGITVNKRGCPKGTLWSKKTTPADRELARRWSKSGITNADIARHLKVSHQAVSQILKAK